MSSIIRHHYNLALGRHSSGETEKLAFRAAESALMGAGLGFISATSKTGLDIGIGKYKAPVDLGVGVLGTVGSLFLPLDKGQREVVERMSATALGIGVFRQTEQFVKRKNATVHGDLDDAEDADLGEDPVIAAARML